MSMKILILGINGFIGHRLTETILSKTDWDIYGMDLSSHRLDHCKRYSRLHFQQGDITKEKKWIEQQLAQCDVVLPLAAIAVPSLYIQDPLKVFELDFEENLTIIKMILEAKKRLVFPSSSEVYGMCQDAEFNETSSHLVLGPIHKERWIYSASKQLLDRVIYAYGKHRDLDFTIFRPFNWIGPRQDEVMSANAEHARVVSRFISAIIHNKNIMLVNGGEQRRCFTYIEDGIEALMKIIENKDNAARKQIFNIGNPANNISIRELAEKIKARAMNYPKYSDLAEQTKIISVDEEEYYGRAYQDTTNRVPNIDNAIHRLGWHPKADIDIALNNTLDFYLS